MPNFGQDLNGYESFNKKSYHKNVIITQLSQVNNPRHIGA